MATLKFIALVVTAITLVPSAAHLFELPGKITLDRDAYFTVQTIYAGWAMFAAPIFAAILANLALSWALWRQRDRRAAWSGLSAALISISLGVFFTFVFPGNQETANWTSQPENWRSLRSGWEYGHAANALLVFAAFVATCLATVSEPQHHAAGGGTLPRGAPR